MGSNCTDLVSELKSIIAEITIKIYHQLTENCITIHDGSKHVGVATAFLRPDGVDPHTLTFVLHPVLCKQ